MTEYLHPGVYDVELEGRTVLIEGVPTSTADLFGTVLLAQSERQQGVGSASAA